jgi:trk system potassium uptake protein TrkA
MKVIVVGCGRVGSALAYQLHREGHQVTVIDQDSAAFDQLSLDFRGRTIKGDVLDRNVLRRAQVEEADALAAVTRSDSLNALVAHVARTEYRVARCVARNADPRQRALQEALGVAIVGSQDWGAQRMMELLSDAPRRVDLEEGGSEFAVHRLEVPESWRGQTLGQLLPEERVHPLAVIRAGRRLQFSHPLPLEAGDVIYLAAEPAEMEAVWKQMQTREEPTG